MSEREPARAAADHQPTNTTATRAVGGSATALSLTDTRPPSASKPYVGKHRCQSTGGPYIMLATLRWLQLLARTARYRIHADRTLRHPEGVCGGRSVVVVGDPDR
jgi:hypothetical protein